MKKLKRSTISKCDEESTEFKTGESLPKISKSGNGKVSTKEPSKLCQLCQKRAGVSLHCEKWCCRSCRGKASAQKVKSKIHKKEASTSNPTSVKDIINSGSFKSMLTIQIQNDGKRSVKEKSDSKESFKEKDLPLTVENQTSFSTTAAKFSEVEDSNETVVNEDNSFQVPGNKESANDVQHSQKSSIKNKVNNISCMKTKESDIIRHFNSVSSNKNAATKFKAAGVKTGINHKERVNGDIGEVIKSSSINSPSVNNISEKSSYEFLLEPDSSLFGCVETCFDHLEEVDLKLFFEYVYRTKKSKNLSTLSKDKSITDICATQNFDHITEKDHNSVESSNNEPLYEINSNNTETLKIGMTNCDKQDISNFYKETSFVSEGALQCKKSSNEKQLPAKQKTTLLTGSVLRSNSEKKKSQICEINKNDLCVISRTNVSEKETPAMIFMPSFLKQSNDECIITSSLPDSPSMLQNEPHCDQYNNTELPLQTKGMSLKKFLSEDTVGDVGLITNSNKTGMTGGQLPVIKDDISNTHNDFNLLTEKEILSDDKIDQHSTSTVNEATAELNLINSESQHSSEKSLVSNDLYSNEAETLDYEPEDDLISPIETLNFTEDFKASEFQKADFNEVMNSAENEINLHLFDNSTQIKSSAQIVKSDRKKKKSSVWEVDSDEDNFDSEKTDMQLNSSSPELLCTVDEDEEKYIDDKVVSQSSPKKEDVSPHTLTSSIPDSSTIKEKLQIGKDNASTRNEVRNVPDFVESENTSRTSQKPVTLDNAKATFQSMHNIPYDLARGYCYQFLRRGTCNRRLCKFVHSKPPLCGVNDNRHRVPNPPQRSRQYSGQNHHADFIMKENMKLDIGPSEGRNAICRMDRDRADSNGMADRNKAQYLRQFGVNNDIYEANPPRDQFQNTNNYKSFDQRNTNIFQLVCENHWNALSHLFASSLYDGTFVKLLKSAFCQQEMYAGSKFQQFINFMTTQSNQELEREKVYILGQIGCSIILESHSAGKFEVAFELLTILHQYDINYYYLQHNINQSLGFPLWGIVTSSWIALVAVDTCVHLEKIAEAIQILEGCKWALPSPQLTPEVKKKETVMRINIFQRLMELTAKQHMIGFVVKILKIILDIFSEDTGDTDLRNSMSDSIKQVYKYYISTLIDNQDLDSAMSLYMYFWKLKPVLNLSSEIHRALIVLSIRNNKDMRARNLFQTCANMGIYKIGEPNLSSLPHCLRVHTSWTSEEMQLALNHYLGQLLSNLVKWEKNFNEFCSQELFSLHIVFNESSLVQKSECLFHFLSPVRLHESRERMIAALEKLTFNLDFEQKTKRTLHIKPNSLHNYFILWKMDNGDDKDVIFSSSLREASNSSTSKILNLSRYSNIDEATDMEESINDGKKSIHSSLHNKMPSSCAINSSHVPLHSFQNCKTEQGFNFDQAFGHPSCKEQTRIVWQRTPVEEKKDLSNSHSSSPLSSHKDDHLSFPEIHDSETNESHAESDFAQKPRSPKDGSLLIASNFKIPTTINSKTSQFSVSSLQVPSNRSVSCAPLSRLKPPPSVSRFHSLSNSGTKKLQLNSISLKPNCKKKSFLPQTPLKVKSHLRGRNKAALAKKYLTTPRKSTERRIIKLKQRQIPSKHESMNPLPVQKPSTNISNCGSSKVYNYIKSQLLCHHKGNSSDKQLNIQAQELTDKFINENIEGDSSNNALLDKKRMKTLVDFAKRHINENRRII